VHIGARGLRESLKKIFGELGFEITDAFRGDSCVDNATGAASEIDGGSGERFVHGHEEISGTQNATF
jgi:hypothetical protein